MLKINGKDNYIIGIDEVGRGPLSGPVVACAFLADNPKKMPDGVQDSKKISSKKRETIAKVLAETFQYGIGYVAPAQIDEINIRNATHLAMQNALAHLQEKIELMGIDCKKITILIDGKDNPFIRSHPESKAIIGGDAKFGAISAASIIAKVYRDKMMKELSYKYPKYLWDQNAGYGTKAHILAIKKYGITEHHRKTFLGKILKNA